MGRLLSLSFSVVQDAFLCWDMDSEQRHGLVCINSKIPQPMTWSFENLSAFQALASFGVLEEGQLQLS